MAQQLRPVRFRGSGNARITVAGQGTGFAIGAPCAWKRRKTMRAENFEHGGECMKHVRERLGKINVRQDALERRRRTSARVELRGKRVFAVHIDTCANHYDTGLVCDLD